MNGGLIVKNDVHCRYIRFQKKADVDEYINLADITVFAPDGSAYNMTDWTSSVSAPYEYSGHSYDSGNMVDGDIDTFVHTDRDFGSWLEVDWSSSSVLQ